MKNNKYKIMLLCVICCIIMAITDAVIRPGYLIKSLIKLPLFLLVPVMFGLYDKNINIKNLFAFEKSGLKTPLFLGFFVYVFIVGGYFLLRNYIDFSAVTVKLQSDVGVNADNFIFVALYISFINSLLEEFFFRGFAFICLRNQAGEKTAYIFSSGLFALYHIAIMLGWFEPWVLALSVLGLFAAGLIFDYSDSKSGNIYTSWLVHACANFAINTVGFILLGVI